MTLVCDYCKNPMEAQKDEEGREWRLAMEKDGAVRYWVCYPCMRVYEEFRPTVKE